MLAAQTTQQTVFTIGHSTHQQQRFIKLLSQHAITALCDVRSMPFSRVNPQFNLDRLKKALPDHGIKYISLGKELGARPEDPTCYEGGKVQYTRLARTELSKRALREYKTALRRAFALPSCAQRKNLSNATAPFWYHGIWYLSALM
jgi:uncharacterized protein (DUF488 family)